MLTILQNKSLSSFSELTAKYVFGLTGYTQLIPNKANTSVHEDVTIKYHPIDDKMYFSLWMSFVEAHSLLQPYLLQNESGNEQNNFSLKKRKINKPIL